LINLTYSHSHGSIHFFADECPAATLEMVGYKGVFVEGSIKPAITQLNIQLSNSNGKELAVQPTDKDGKYRCLYSNVAIFHSRF